MREQTVVGSQKQRLGVPSRGQEDRFYSGDTINSLDGFKQGSSDI